MVLVEELAEDEAVTANEWGRVKNVEEETKENSMPTPSQPALSKGFLQKEHEPLYPKEGSAEGKVSADTHKAHDENKMNEKLNDGMNRGAVDNNGHERPAWYTKEWPKDCQYNSPGCVLEDLQTSAHSSEMIKEMTRKSNRWTEVMAPGLTSMRMSFMSVCDDDIRDLIAHLKGNEAVTELDLSHNQIKDKGIQDLVGCLANGGAPNLKELRCYKNEFGELGTTMLTKGLSVFRKKLTIIHQEPTIPKFDRPAPAAPSEMD
jgi:hypothetical protein